MDDWSFLGKSAAKISVLPSISFPLSGRDTIIKSSGSLSSSVPLCVISTETSSSVSTSWLLATGISLTEFTVTVTVASELSLTLEPSDAPASLTLNLNVSDPLKLK